MTRTTAALLVLLSAATTSAEPVSPAEEARKLNREGSKLFAARRFPEALEKFRAAQERYPTPALWVNIGSVLRELGKNAEAIEEYEKFLAEPTTGPERRPAVKAAIKELAAKAGRIVVRLSEAGAAVAVDGRRANASGRQVSFWVDPGSHLVVAELEGFTPATATLTVAAGEEQPVDLRLVAIVVPEPTRVVVAPRAAGGQAPEPTIPSSAANAPKRDSRWYSDTIGWVIAGSGVVVVGVGAGFMFKASSLEDDADAETDAIKKIDLRDEADSRRNWGYGLLAIGGATLVTGIIKLAWHDAPTRKGAASEMTMGPGWLGFRRKF